MTQKIFKKYRIYASLIDHISDGFVMVNNACWERRTIVKIIPKGKSKSCGVWCEALNMDKYLRKAYNNKNTTMKIPDDQDAIVLSKWYRNELGINTKEDAELCLYKPGWFIALIGKIVACLKHPVVGIRVATWLAIVSIVIGIIGLIPSCSSKSTREHRNIQFMIEKVKSDIRATNEKAKNIDTVHNETQQLLDQSSRLLKSVDELAIRLVDYHKEISRLSVKETRIESGVVHNSEAEKPKK